MVIIAVLDLLYRVMIRAIFVRLAMMRGMKKMPPMLLRFGNFWFVSDREEFENGQELKKTARESTLQLGVPCRYIFLSGKYMYDKLRLFCLEGGKLSLFEVSSVVS